jgi:uncharacterized protein (TIGR03437 family)
MDSRGPLTAPGSIFVRLDAHMNKTHTRTISRGRALAFIGLACLCTAALVSTLPRISTALAQQTRTVRTNDATFNRNQNNDLTVDLVAIGNENNVAFSLQFDPTQFNYLSTVLGTGAAGASLNIDISQLLAGRVGVRVLLPAGQTFAAGTHQIARISYFVTSATQNSAVIAFANQPVAGGVFDVNGASATPVTFTPALITFNPQISPVPVVTSISPNAAIVGSPDFTMTVTGSGFVPGSIVTWNGESRATVFVSPTSLTALIPATDLTVAVAASVAVANPTPGGGNSNAVSFTITNPVPTITSIAPTSAVVGSGAFSLAVNGTNFVSGAKVRWNGSDRTTTLVSSTQLIAQIPAADVAQVTNASVTVFNPAPGGGGSNPVSFAVQSTNPLPRLSSLTPNFIPQGSPQFTLTITGTRFGSNSVVHWNGADRPTTFVSDTQLQATIPASDLVNPTTALINVFNPPPGGGTSNALVFTVIAPQNPVPVLTSITPESVFVGTGPVTLTVNGTDFSPTSVVRLEGSDRPTQFVSASQLTVTIPVEDLTLARQVSIVVFTPPPGGGSSGSLTLAIVNPVAVVTSINPTTVSPGGGNFQMFVTGTGFVPGSQVLFNGQPKPTSFVSSTQLQAAIFAADVVNPGIAVISVLNGAPGGGISNELTLTIGQPGFEGDVTPRGTGDNKIDASDQVQIGRFVAGLDLTNPGQEFQRADCAPRETHGDGRLTVSDWVQAGRYAAGLDPLTAASGPTSPVQGATGQAVLEERNSSSPVEVQPAREVHAALAGSGSGLVVVSLNALGDENAIGFSLSFDPAKVRFVSAAAGSGAAGAILQTNPLQAEQGRVGMILILPAGQTIAAGLQSVVVATFAPVETGGIDSSVITFGDSPVSKELVSVNATNLPAVWTLGAARELAVVSAASFDAGAVSPGSIAAAFGTNLAVESLPTSLTVIDSIGASRLAKLLFVSAGQINYIIPEGTAAGPATVMVASGDGVISIGSTRVAPTAAGLFAANGNGKGAAAGVALRVLADGSQSYQALSVYDLDRREYVAAPVDLSNGDVYLVLFGTGLRGATAGSVSLKVGDQDVPVTYAGAQGTYAGLDQINARLPRDLTAKGELEVVLTVEGGAANTVKVAVK